jgi:hypothetical protein
MRKNLLFFVLAILMFSCQNSNKENSLNENGGDSQTFQMLTFSKDVLKKLSNIEGDFLYGFSWIDKAGVNQLLFTKAVKFVQMRGEEQGIGDEFGYLKAYHFAGENDNYKLIRMIQDGNSQGCSSPPFAIDLDFYEKSISITDLDENGYAEVVFMYYILCASEICPVPTKLMLLENGEKHAIRGDSYIAEINIGGEKNTDASFKKLNPKIQDLANQTWEKFCKTKP